VCTSGIVAGGYSTAVTTATETFNGTSWTSVSSMNTGRDGLMGSGSSSTDQIVYGGSNSVPAIVANTEYWNGSSWTEVNDLGTATRVGGSTKGGTTTALAIGGSNPGGRTTNTEEWNAPPISIKTFTTS
jgi:hypothetical protein